MVLLISYDLNDHERPKAYTAVKEKIQEAATSFKKPLYSQWLIETTATPQQWYEHLKSVVDQNDKLLIVQVKQPYFGWLTKDVWEWLSSRV